MLRDMTQGHSSQSEQVEVAIGAPHNVNYNR